MVGSLDMVDVTKDHYQTLEFFAGASRMAKLSHHLGLPSAAVDKLFDDADNKCKNNSMDFNTSGGFLFLAIFNVQSKVYCYGAHTWQEY